MKIKIWSKLLFCSLLLAVFVGFVFLADYQNNKAIEINYQTQVVKTEKLSYASLSEMFEDLSASTTEDGTKIVTSTLKLKGDSLDNITYTSNEAEQNLVISSVTQTAVDGTSTAHLNFDFGDFEEDIFATSNIQFVNGEITGTVTFEGQEYDAKEVLAEYLGENGINECFWWCFIKVIVIVIQVIIVAQTAYDLYQYLTMEEVTIEGVLSIVCEGLVMSAVDLSGRCAFVYNLNIPTQKVGDFDTELVEEFWVSFARNVNCNLHINEFYGKNSHHIIECAFKCVARSLKEAVSYADLLENTFACVGESLKEAVEIDQDFKDEIPSTKGVL